MATSINTRVSWDNAKTQKTSITIWSNWLTFADSQAKNKTFWFLFSLIFQGVFFLPLPAALTFYYNAPIYTLVITLILFFANVIAGMGGSGIRTMLALFAASILVHIAMMAIYML